MVSKQCHDFQRRYFQVEHCNAQNVIKNFLYKNVQTFTGHKPQSVVILNL